MEQIKDFDFEGKSWIFIHTPLEEQHDHLLELFIHLEYDTTTYWQDNPEHNYKNYQEYTVIWITGPASLTKLTGVQSMDQAGRNEDVRVRSYDEFINTYFQKPIDLNTIIDDLDARIKIMEQKSKS